MRGITSSKRAGWPVDALSATHLKTKAAVSERTSAREQYMDREMKTNAYAVSQIGIIGLPTVCYDARQARRQAVESEREYLLDDEKDMTDQEIWRRLYRQGFRVIPVVIHHSAS